MENIKPKQNKKAISVLTEIQDKKTGNKLSSFNNNKKKEMKKDRYRIKILIPSVFGHHLLIKTEHSILKI